MSASPTSTSSPTPAPAPTPQRLRRPPTRAEHLLRWGGRAAAVLAVLGALYVTFAVYLVGETLLALVLLVITTMSLWVYTSARTQAMRYLFPGVAAALVFVVFPMVYTIVTGFTNHSTRNLLDRERARQVLLGERILAPGTVWDAELLPAPGGTAEAGPWRLRLSAPGQPAALLSPPLRLDGRDPARLDLVAEAPAGQAPVSEDPGRDVRPVIAHLAALKGLALRAPGDGPELRLKSLREFAPLVPQYQALPDGGLRDGLSGAVLHANDRTGFFETAQGAQVMPGFIVGVGWQNYARVFTDPKFSEPFLRIFVWTLVFSALTVVCAGSLGLLLAVVLNWEALQCKGAYRLILFLPYAVPGFISILVFKGLFNPNQGEINLILDHLFGIRPAWFSDPFLAKLMLLIVNTWLGFPYMMVLCTGLIKSLPGDIYEASAVEGAGPLTNFFQLTLPLILKPLTPLLISAFAFNFNNFVLISLLTNGRPDFLDTSVPAGTTDILVSYTWRIAFQDSGQQFGLASALSTLIFLLVAAVTLAQMHFTKVAEAESR